MDANPVSAVITALRRASERLGTREDAETAATLLANRERTLAPSIRDLRRPVQAGESGAGGSGRPSQDMLKALMFAIEHGDRQAKEVAEALACSLIARSMMTRLLDPRRGSVPGFVNRLQKSVESFEEKFH